MGMIAKTHFSGKLTGCIVFSYDMVTGMPTLTSGVAIMLYFNVLSGTAKCIAFSGATMESANITMAT